MNDMGRSPRYASAGDCGLPLLGGARPDFSVRSRDLFPLPVPPRLESTSGLSRRSSQRLCRKVRKMDTVREAVHGLNWLAGRVFYMIVRRLPMIFKGRFYSEFIYWPKIPATWGTGRGNSRGRQDGDETNLRVAVQGLQVSRHSIWYPRHCYGHGRHLEELWNHGHH